MSNAIIAYGNLTDTATLSGGSWNASFPLTNLQKRQRGIIARSVNALATSTTFVASLAAPSYIGALSLEAANPTIYAQVRWSTYTDAALTNLVYDSGTYNVYPGTPPTVAEIALYQRSIRHIPTTRAYAQYVKCEIFDTSNTTFQVGRLFIGNTFQPKVSMNYGAAIQLRSQSTVNRTVNGNKFYTVRRPGVTFPFAFNYLSEVELMLALDLQAQVDLTGEAMFIWDPADLANQYRKSVFGELAQLDPLQYPNYSHRSLAFQIEGTL